MSNKFRVVNERRGETLKVPGAVGDERREVRKPVFIFFEDFVGDVVLIEY